MTHDERGPASAAKAAARLLNPASSPPATQEKAAVDDGTPQPLAELTARVHALEQEIQALTRRVRKLERARPIPST
ncbi:hypothetical protein BS329_38595 [Amycolatopsis coloradensis]|uniref:Uncharacterized protein n=1 Tax=Amycolatopsis coloradensis TaxID=76021 RepID=A0A1R0KEI2_9PSEU|nr:hypothetical protein [Amycolatopsis coloradensis]OLZ43569.1 hypothetical protein BS329_38595 [Amycolatopsis coloradensis]